MTRAFFTLISATIFLTSCSWFSKPTEERPPANESPTAVGVEQVAPNSVRSDLSDIEIVWRASADPVDSYMVRYGFSKAALTESIAVSVEDAIQSEDEANGEVLTYTLKNVPTDKSVYIAVSAIRGGDVSPMSEIFEVAPVTAIR